jgi:hypothetical protein
MTACTEPHKRDGLAGRSGEGQTDRPQAGTA